MILTFLRKSDNAPEIFFSLTEDNKNESNSVNSSTKIPPTTMPPQTLGEHKFAISDIKNQTLAVFSQSILFSILMFILCIKVLFSSCLDENKSLALEGSVVQKGECRPIGDAHYMMLKKESIRIASQPTKVVQKIDRAVNNFKPINAHRSEVRNYNL